MAERERDVVLNFKMDGQVQYAQTLKQINAVMNTAAKEYKNHIAAMGQDASVTDKLRAEKKKLEIQMEAAQKRTAMLRSEYEAMAADTNTTTEQLTAMYSKLLDAERAETALARSMDRVSEGLSEQAIEARDAQEALKSLNEQSKLLEAEQKSLTSSFKLQRAELDENASEADKAALAQRELAFQMELTERVISNLENQLEQAKKVYGENSIEVKQLETKLNEAKSTMKSFEKSLDSAGDSAETAGNSMDELGKKMDLNNLLEATQLLQGVSDALIQVGQAAMNSALSFGDSQTNLQANLGLTAEEAEKLNGTVEEVFKNGVVGSIEEATQAVTLVKQSFGDLDNTQLEKLTNNITTIAKRTGTDVQENVNAASKLMNAFGITGEQATDLIATGFQNGLNKSGDFLATVDEYAPHFQNAGFSADQMMQIIQNGMKNGALNTDIAADAIKELQIRMGDGSFEKVLTSFSKGTQDTFQKWKDGKATVADVANSISTDLNKMTPTEQQAALSTLATQFEDLGIDGAAALFQVGDAFTNVNGKADEMAQKSPGEKWQASLRELQTSFQPIGQQLVDGLTPVIDLLVKMGEGFEKLPGPAQIFITVFGAVLAIAAIAIPIILGVAAAGAALNIAWLPVIAIILAVAAAIAGIILVIQNWGAITDWLGEKWNQFTSWLADGTSKLASDFVNWFNEMKQGAIDKFNELKESAGNSIQNFKNDAVNKVNELKTDFINKANELKDGAVEKFNGLKERASSVMQSAKDAIVSPIQSAKDKIGGIIEGIKGFFSGLSLKIPEISLPKLPKFSIDGEFSLNPPSVPRLSVKWNAKGGIFTEPTIFGMHNGQLQGAGEVPGESEALIPLNEKTLGAIGKGIAATMGGNNRPIIIQVDGKSFAQVIGDYTDAEGGTRIRRIERGLA